MSNHCYTHYIKNIENSIIKDPKQFWNYVNKMRYDYQLPNSMFYDSVKDENNCYRMFFCWLF